MFTKAIVRTPARSMVDGITTASLGSPDFDLALEQHQAYIKVLEDCGLEVTVLPALEEFPDSCFVEDVALLTSKCGIITRPGAFSRRDEAKHMQKTVAGFYSSVENISSPGSIDAGDIMMVGDHFYIGRSERTNSFGAKAMIKILEKYDMTGSTIDLRNVLHLKTGVAYLENNKLLAAGEFLNELEFQKFDILPVEHDEAYAANSIWVNNKILMPTGFPNTKAMLEAEEFDVIEIDASEFQKMDGGLSCLSLRF